MGRGSWSVRQFERITSLRPVNCSSVRSPRYSNEQDDLNQRHLHTFTDGVVSQFAVLVHDDDDDDYDDDDVHFLSALFH